MRTWLKATSAAALIAGLLALTTGPAGATTVLKQDLIDLISLSELILVGDVTNVTDGFQGGAPYTEITMNVSQSIKGNILGTYTFRQFGLTAPREMPDGRTSLGVSPDGWPRFLSGEKVIVFLYQAGSATGFRTTVGLFQGKFDIKDGNVSNGIQNQGLFNKVVVDPKLATDAQTKMLGTEKGAVPADAFLSLVRRAVQDKWIENGSMRHEAN